MEYRHIPQVLDFLILDEQLYVLPLWEYLKQAGLVDVLEQIEELEHNIPSQNPNVVRIPVCSLSSISLISFAIYRSRAS